MMSAAGVLAVMFAMWKIGKPSSAGATEDRPGNNTKE